jgi:hypothetical protein
MIDPTSDIGEDVDESDAPTCHTCGKKIVAEPNHRIVSWVEDGSVVHLHFCDDDCRRAWSGRRPGH